MTLAGIHCREVKAILFLTMEFTEVKGQEAALCGSNCGKA